MSTADASGADRSAWLRAASPDCQTSMMRAPWSSIDTMRLTQPSGVAPSAATHEPLQGAALRRVFPLELHDGAIRHCNALHVRIGEQYRRGCNPLGARLGIR